MRVFVPLLILLWNEASFSQGIKGISLIIALRPWCLPAGSQAQWLLFCELCSLPVSVHKDL